MTAIGCSIWSRLTATLAMLLVLYLTPTAFCQVNPVGSLDGEVRDGSSALLTRTQVTLTNIGTNVKSSSPTNERGAYYFNLLPPGEYRLEAERSGFRTFSRNLTVEAGRKLTVDITMSVGDMHQKVEVVGDAPMIETSSASASTTVNSRFVAELPLSGRNAVQLSMLSAGVVQTSAPMDSYGLDNRTGVAYFSTNGANYRMNNFLMDGVPNEHFDTICYMPPADQVQEVNIQTNSFDAEYGHNGGAYVSVITKSGTNQIHGSLYEYLRNDAMNATNFFTNLSGLAKPALRYNQFGGAAGGPAIKNKTFWFVNYEGVRYHTPTPYIFTVPTAAQRGGDFSKTLASNGVQIGIFDPFSTRPDPNRAGSYIRTPFSGNAIPASRLDPVAVNVLAAYVPLPNRPGDPFSGTNNVAETIINTYAMNNFTARVDHNLGTRHRIFARSSRTSTKWVNPNPVDIGTERNSLAQVSAGLGDTITLTPTTVLVLSAGFTRYDKPVTKTDVDLVKLGFSPAWVNLLQQTKLGTMSNTDMIGVGASGGNRFDIGNQYSLLANMSHYHGRQNMKWGFQMQIRQNNSIGSNSPSGAFSFDRSFTQGSDPNTRGATLGDGIASFLLGTPASGSTTLAVTGAAQTPYYGMYFQDDIHVSSRLTVGLGVRYDLKLPANERFNNLSRWAFGVTNPIQAAAQAAYAANPIPELAAAQFQVLGGLTFPTNADRRAAQTDTRDWSPRIGVVYRLTDKMALRAGYGLFYDYWSTADFSQLGFSSSTPMLTTSDGVTPLNLLRNPFPGGLIQPPGSSQGLTTLLGTNVAAYPDRDNNPYNERWQFGIQRELAKDLRLEVNYVGETAQHLYLGNRGSGSGGEMTRELHFLPAQYLALGSRLQTTVANPFAGLIPSSLTLGQPKISIQNLLMTYPEMGDLTVQRSTGGRSYYDGLQATATKRFSHHFQVLATYTFMRQIEKLQFMNDADPAPSKAIGQLWTPHRFTFAGVLELPFGDGKQFLNRPGIVNKVAGGWQLSVIQVFQSGSALLIPDVLFTGVNPSLPPDQRTVGLWFNTAAFKTLPAFTLRTVSTRFAQFQGDAIDNWDLSLSKSTRISERFRLQLRGEAFNAMNRAQMGGPNMTPSSGSYGRVTSQANAPRSLQIGLRLEF